MLWVFKKTKLTLFCPFFNNTHVKRDNNWLIFLPGLSFSHKTLWKDICLPKFDHGKIEECVPKMNTVSFKMIRAYIVFSKVGSTFFVSQCFYIFKKTSSLKGVVLRSCITKRPLLHRDAGGGQQTKIRCVYGQHKHSSSQN